MLCDIMKIGGLVRSKEKFAKRRQRLVGPNGSTLKAIELLTQCYVLVQGRTVSIMGSVKGLKQVHRIVEDCFNNVHPVYHIKELMIRRELEKDPEMKNENWDRFLPHFKKQNHKRKTIKRVKKKKSIDFDKPHFPPRKVDMLLASGEYFLNEQERALKRKAERIEMSKAKSAEKKRRRAMELQPPATTSKQSAKNLLRTDETGEDTREMVAKIQGKSAAQSKKTKSLKHNDILLG